MPIQQCEIFTEIIRRLDAIDFSNHNSIYILFVAESS